MTVNTLSYYTAVRLGRRQRTSPRGSSDRRVEQPDAIPVVVGDNPAQVGDCVETLGGTLMTVGGTMIEMQGMAESSTTPYRERRTITKSEDRKRSGK